MTTKRLLPALAVAVSMMGGMALAVAPQPSETYFFATYRVKDQGLSVLVDAYPASLHAKDPFIPVPIAVGMDGKGERIRFTRESFELVDSSGNVYPLASFTRLMSDYEKRTFDESIFRVRPMTIGNQFATFHRVVSRFFPAPGRGTRVDRVEIYPFTWFQDVLYFPRPEAGMGGVLTLRVKPRGLEKPIAVRFQVPAKGTKEDGSAD